MNKKKRVLSVQKYTFFSIFDDFRVQNFVYRKICRNFAR